MEKLKRYLKASKLRQDHFAERVKTTPSTMSRILSGKHLPDLPLAVAIERETGGTVRCKDWITK